MKSKQIALRIENKSLRGKIRKSLIAHGFEDRTDWNNEWESEPRINHIIIRDFDRIEFHSHSGSRTADKDVITIEPNSFDALFLTL